MTKKPKAWIAICLLCIGMLAIIAPASAWGEQSSWNNQPSASSCLQTAIYIGSAAGYGAISGPAGWIYAASNGYRTFQSAYQCGTWIGNQLYR